MAGFLDGYEDVAARIKRLHSTFPTNRVETSIVDFNAQAGYILIECRIFREYEDEKPSAIDYAFGRVESYNPSMKRWFVEDTVTSAISKPFAEEGFATAETSIAEIAAQLGGELIEEAPLCKHGHMLLKEGTSKTGKAYHGYVCTEKLKANQCNPIWYTLTAEGKWKVQW